MTESRTLTEEGLPWWLSSEESACNAGAGLIPRLGRSPGEGNSNPLRYSGLGNPMDREAWWVQSMGSQKNGTQLRD